MNKKLAELLLLIAAIFWGLGYIGVDLLLNNGMGSFTLIATRFGIASILLIIVFFPKMKLKKSDLVPIFLVGGALFLAYCFQTTAMLYTTTTNVSFITGMYIVFVPLIEFCILKKKITSKHALAVLITIIALLILTGGINNLHLGDLLTVVSAFLFGLHIVLISYYSQKVDITRLAIGQMVVTSALSFIICFILKENIILQSRGNIGVLVFLALIPSALCFFLQNVGLKYADASKGSIILGTEAFWGSLFAVTLLGEHFTLNVIIGGALMFSAMFLDNLKLWKSQ